MATRTQSRSSSSTRSGNRSTSRSGNGNSRPQSRKTEHSAFSWGDNAGPLLGAALAGAAIGFAANYGRKFLMQGLGTTDGDGDQILAAEHEEAERDRGAERQDHRTGER